MALFALFHFQQKRQLCSPPLSSVLKSSEIRYNRTTKAMQDLTLQSCGQPKVLSRPLTTHF